MENMQKWQLLGNMHGKGHPHERQSRFNVPQRKELDSNPAWHPLAVRSFLQKDQGASYGTGGG